MPKRFQRYASEVQEVKSRIFTGSWTVGSYEFASRLISLKAEIETNESQEICRHIVVSCLAALETDYRSRLVSIMEQKSDYQHNAARSLNEKISLEEALEITGAQNVSFAEIAAHLAPFNKVEDIIAWPSRILGIDVKHALHNAVNPYDLRNGSKNPEYIFEDLESTLATLDEAFTLRHILVHEAASNTEIPPQFCMNVIDSVKIFSEGFDAMLWTTAFCDLPLTQAEMNIYAFDTLKSERQKLAKTVKNAYKLSKEIGAGDWFRMHHFQWKFNTKIWFRETYFSWDGSLWRSVGAAQFASSLKGYRKQLRSWLTAHEADDD